MTDKNEELVKSWHGSGPLWDKFVRWSSYACSPGAGNGHLVEWYWKIFQEGAAANSTALTEAEGKIAALEQDAGRYRWLRSQPMLDGWALVSLEIMDFNEDGPTGKLYSHDGVELDAAIDAARSEEQP